MPEINDVSAAVAAAKAEVSEPEAAETPAAETPAAEAKPESTPEARPAGKPAAQADGDGGEEEDFYNPTADELAAIEKSPELKKVYRALRGGFTKKTQALSAREKELKARAEVADFVQQNPEQAARILAQHAGLTIAEQKKEETTKVADELEEEWSKTVGVDAAKLLRPVIEKTAKRIVEGIVGPITEQVQGVVQASNQRGIAASVSEFGASIVQRGDEWTDEIQAEMAKIVDKIEPAEGATVTDVLDIAYDKVLATRSRAKTARENLARLRRIRDEQEPTTTARAGEAQPQKIDGRMSEKDAVAAAVASARSQLGVR